MTIISIASRQSVPIENMRVVAAWHRPDNSGIAIAHVSEPGNGKPFYSWETDTRGDKVPSTRQEHWTEKDALDRIVQAVEGR